MEHHLPDDVTTFAPVLPRSSVPVTYYFVDFGISTQFDPEDTNRFVTGADGLDREPLELSDDIPYDPFKLDVFDLGIYFQQSVLNVSDHLHLLMLVGLC